MKTPSHSPKHLSRFVAASLVWVALMAHGHEPAAPPKATDIGPVRGKTVKVTQAQIDLVLSAQPEITRMTPESVDQTRIQVRSILIERALLERGALEVSLDKDPRVQLELQAARQAVLAKAFGRYLADPKKVTEKDIEAEYQAALSQLADTEYHMRRLSFVDKDKAEEAVKALGEGVVFETVMSQLAVPSVEEKPGEWRWIASKLMPESVAEEVKRLARDSKARPQPARVEGTWYVVQVQGHRPMDLPQRAEIQQDLRMKLGHSRVQAWLNQRMGSEGLDKQAAMKTSKERL